MKIALIRPPEVNPYWSSPEPLLGAGYLAAYLESHGYDVRILDANYHGWTQRQIINGLVEYGPDLVGFSSMTHEIKAAHAIAVRMKDRLKEVPTVVGGCHVTALPSQTLQEFPEFTYGVFGEGEETLLELVRYLEKGTEADLQNIAGLVHRDQQNRIVCNVERPSLAKEKLDKLPYPALHQYHQNAHALKGPKRHYTIMAGRGCPYQCAFCMQVLGRQVRRRSAENIVGEMEHAIHAFGAHTIYFADEIFLFNDRITYETFELIKQRGLPKRIRWRANTRVNLVNDRLLKAAKEAGCYLLEIGIESGNDEILKAINKQITVEQAETAVQSIKKAGIGVSANFILGHPHETRQTIKATVDLATRLNTDTIAVGLMVPYPGTRIYEMAKRGEGGYRLLTEDWSSYDKYGNRALEIEGLPINVLETWQRKSIVYFYIKNFRFIDFFRFIFEYRKTILKLIFRNHAA